MGHQYRLNYQEMGMRRIFPIVLIRGLPIPVEQISALYWTKGKRATPHARFSRGVGFYGSKFTDEMLPDYGIDGNELEWVKRYLQNRKQIDSHEAETPDERAETSSSESSDIGTPSTSSSSSTRLPPPRVPVSIQTCRRIRRLKRPRSSQTATQPLRRSPRLNQARQQL